MEAIGSFFFILVLLAGVLCLFTGKRKLGAILVAVSFVFLYVIPLAFYSDYREGYYGVYESNAGKTLTIYKDHTYSLYTGSKLMDTSSVSFMNIDDGYIVFDGTSHVKEKDGTIVNSSDTTEIFSKTPNE